MANISTLLSTYRTCVQLAWHGMACRVVLSVCQLSWQNYKHYYLVRSSKDDSFAFLPIFCRYLFVRIMRIMMRNAYTKGLHLRTYVSMCRMRIVQHSLAIDILGRMLRRVSACGRALLCMPREHCKTCIHSVPLSMLLMWFFIFAGDFGPSRSPELYYSTPSPLPKDE